MIQVLFKNEKISKNFNVTKDTSKTYLNVTKNTSKTYLNLEISKLLSLINYWKYNMFLSYIRICENNLLIEHDILKQGIG